MTSPRKFPSLRINRLLGALVVFCCLVHPGRTAWAADDLCQADPACSDLDDRGEKFYHAKQYGSALDAFTKAFAVEPEPRIMLNIGRCQHWLGQYDAALQSYAKYKELVPVPAPEMSKRLTQFIQDAERAQREHSLTVVTPAPAKPVYKKWWFWTTIGVVAAAAIAGGIGGGLAARAKDFSSTTGF